VRGVFMVVSFCWLEISVAGTEISMLGFEIKRTAAPAMTRSAHVAIENLDLQRLDVIHAGDHSFALAQRASGSSSHPHSRPESDSSGCPPWDRATGVCSIERGWYSPLPRVSTMFGYGHFGNRNVTTKRRPQSGPPLGLSA